MSHESLRLAASLCSSFDQQTARLLAVCQGVRDAQDKRASLEAQETREAEDYDAKMNEYLEEIASIERKAEEATLAKSKKEEGKGLEKNILQEIEKLRKIVRQLEEHRDKLECSVTQKKQKQQEVVLSRQALIESRRNLKQENEKLKADIMSLEKDLQEKTGSIHCEMFDNTKNTQIIREGKFDFRKRVQEATAIEKKFAKAQENLGKDAKKLEARKSRLSTLREVNKTLHRRLQTKKELEQRYIDLTEQSLNLQFLISEVMRDLAKKYDIRSDEIEEVNPEEFVTNPKEIMDFQAQKIDSLNHAIRDQHISNTKKKYENLVYH
jgi:chromosome segregation ATPase